MSIVPEEELLHYLNEARTRPWHFASYIQEELDSFTDDKTLPLRPGCNFKTTEGRSAWREALQFVKNFKGTQPYKLNRGLCYSAQDHAWDMSKNSFFSHRGSDGSTFSERIERRCGKVYGSEAECITNDFVNKGRNYALKAVLMLVIDDGSPSRGHRKTVFSDVYKYVGSCTKYQGDKVITVLDLHSENIELKNFKMNDLDVGTRLQSEKYEDKPIYKDYTSDIKDKYGVDLNKKYGNSYNYGDANKGTTKTYYQTTQSYSTDKFGNKYGDKFQDKYADKFGDKFADKFNTDKFGSDKYSSDRFTSDKYGSDRFGSDKFGTDKYGSDKFQVERPFDGKRMCDKGEVPFVVSEQSQVSTKVVNGKKTKTTVTKLKYSNGDEKETVTTETCN